MTDMERFCGPQVEEHRWANGCLALRTIRNLDRTVDEYYDRNGQIDRQLTSSFLGGGQQYILDRHFGEARWSDGSPRRIIIRQDSWEEHWLGRAANERERFLQMLSQEMQQVWEIQFSLLSMGGVICQGDFRSPPFRVLEWTANGDATCSISFYAPGSIRLDAERLLIDDFPLKIDNYNISQSSHNFPCVVSVDLTVDRFEEERIDVLASPSATKLIRVFVADEHHPSQLRSQWFRARRNELMRQVSDYYGAQLRYPYRPSDYETSQIPAICRGCHDLYGKVNGGNLMVCAMHPYGNGEDCSDFEAKH